MFSDLNIVCDTMGLKFVEIKSDLEDFIGADPVIGYYFAPGPSPMLSTLVLDIFVLTDQYLCNHEVSKKENQYSKACYVVFLQQLTAIREKPERQKEDEFIGIHFDTSGGPGLALYDKLIRMEDIREFCLKTKDARINRQRSTQ